MRLTTFTDYSLRVMVFLATDPARQATIAEIADSFDISENHLMKVVHGLGKHGLLTNVRGKGGGIRLARDPSTINVGKIVRATENDCPAECFQAESNHCNITPVCKLRHVMEEAVDAFYAVLDRYTLEDLVHNRRSLARILFQPASRH